MDTFPNLLKNNVNQRGSATAIRAKRYGIWQSYSWSSVYDEVQKYAGGLASKGLQAGDKIALIGNNIQHFYSIIAATHCLGATVVPIHPDTGTEELRGILVNCDAKFAVVQDQQQVDAIYDVIKDCPNLVEVFFQDERGMQQYDHTHLKSLDNLEEAGVKFLQSSSQHVDDAIAKVGSDDDAFILYTSGATDMPKGVVHTHASFIATAKAFVEREKVGADEDVLAYMPLAYATSILFNYSLWLLCGFTINCPESNETISSDMREVGPTLFFGPPHFYKRLYTEIYSRAQVSKSNRYDKAISKAMTNRQKYLDGKSTSVGNSFLSDLLVFGPLKNIYGLTRIKRAYVGGDLMTEEAFDFYRAIGVNLKKLYGLTEAAGCVAIQTQEDLKTREGQYLIGKPLPGVEVKLLDNGEIAFKGPNAFKEYHSNPEATQQVKQSDGWVRTGDYGEQVNGGIKLIDLMDNLGQFSTGARYTPKLIESILKESPYVKNALVSGKDCDQVYAIVALDAHAIGVWADSQGLRFTGYVDLISKPEIKSLVKSLASRANDKIKHVLGQDIPAVSRITVLHREFRIETGEFTRSRKICRRVMMAHYAPVFEALRSGESTYSLKNASGNQVATLSLVDV